MPTVPIAQNRVGVASISGAMLQAPDMRGTGLEAIGHGLQEVGAAGADFARVMADNVEQQQLADAKDGDTALVSSASDLLDDPDHGVLAMRGKQAADAYRPTLDALKARADEIGKTIKGKRATLAWQQAKAQRLETWQSTLARHAIKERETYLGGVSDARITVNASSAVNAYDDPKRSEQAVATVASEMYEVGRRNSWGEERTAAEALVKVSAIRRSVAMRQAEASPDMAEAYRKQYAEQITGTDAAAIEKGIANERAQRAAEARRVDAEARADAAHNVTIKREELATLHAQLDTGAGTSADWSKLADDYTAIGDTSSAASARSRGVQMKASDAYRGATLPQIDQRIGALEGKRELNPTEASELKGLRDRRTATDQRLSQPGGALVQYQFATGKALDPIDPQDPASYQRRANRATAAARMYGRQTVEPLTEAEAQPLKDLAQGDANARLRALTEIAKFGTPAAIAGAARQVAGSDDGAFRVAATLSTLPGDAGRQAVRDILRGPEAAKTNGGVFLPSQAKMEFSAYAGPALRGLPSGYGADVMSAAQSLYTARMTTAGRSEWNDQAWHDSIDTVLGGYRAGGQKYGGVAEFRTSDRAGSVVIPPGWTSDGVFRRLARATGDDWRKATTTAAPVWPDGSPVYSGQLRELLPVRVGGTGYAFLTTNNRYLGTKGGKPFVVDVAKLPWK